jgi:hypothetical protein
MNDIKPSSSAAAALIESLLYERPFPVVADWKSLIQAHPSLAEEIADFAIWFGETNRADNQALDTPVDEVLANATKSSLLSVLYSNTAPVEQAKAALQKCKGPAARAVAREIGLGERVDLLDQVVSGEARAPYALVKRLARKFELHLAAVAEVFAVNFQNRPVQAFKTDGKPEMSQQPVSWKEAVDAAGVKGEEAKRLLQLEREMD